MFTAKYKKRDYSKSAKDSVDDVMFVVGGAVSFLVGLFGSYDLSIKLVLMSGGALVVSVPLIISTQSDKLYITVNSKGIHGHMAYFKYREFTWDEIHNIDLSRSLLKIYGSNGKSVKSGIWRLDLQDRRKLNETIKKYSDEYNIPLQIR